MDHRSFHFFLYSSDMKNSVLSLSSLYSVDITTLHEGGVFRRFKTLYFQQVILSAQEFMRYESFGGVVVLFEIPGTFSITVHSHQCT